MVWWVLLSYNPLPSPNRQFRFSVLKSQDLASLKLTYPLKMMVSNRNLLFQGCIFRCHVSFREGTWNTSFQEKTNENHLRIWHSIGDAIISTLLLGIHWVVLELVIFESGDWVITSIHPQKFTTWSLKKITPIQQGQNHISIHLPDLGLPLLMLPGFFGRYIQVD